MSCAGQQAASALPDHGRAADRGAADAVQEDRERGGQQGGADAGPPDQVIALHYLHLSTNFDFYSFTDGKR